MTRSNYISPVIFHILILLTGGNSTAQNTHAKTANGEQANSSVASYERYFDSNKDGHLKEFMELVAIPTISSDPANKPDIDRAAAWIVDKLKAIGMTTALALPTEGNPVVYGSWEKAPGKPTVLIYAHYDVQPVKEWEWDNPPFAPKVIDGKIVGRGASDDKSGIMIPVWAVEAMLMTDGKLPVNVKFIFDGEEEMGSPNFKSFVIKNKELLKADFALNADGDQYNEDTPAMLMSLRGGMAMEFTVKTADVDGHSGQFGGKTPNAAVAMSQIIASLFTKEGNVAVEGFYDKVLPITAAEKEMIKKIPYDKSVDMKILGTTAEVGDTTFSPLERVWYRPTLEITGIESGSSANIIPGKAKARIMCRLVAQQTSAEIRELIINYINKNCPVGATVTYSDLNPGGGSGSGMKFPADTNAFQYISDALYLVYGKKPLLIGIGGSIPPLKHIKEFLGIYPYSLGFQLPDDRAHGSNESFRLSGIRKGQLIYCYYLQHLAKEESKLKK